MAPHTAYSEYDWTSPPTPSEQAAQHQNEQELKQLTLKFNSQQTHQNRRWATASVPIEIQHNIAQLHQYYARIRQLSNVSETTSNSAELLAQDERREKVDAIVRQNQPLIKLVKKLAEERMI
jgi:hypothetical protein